MQLNIITGTDQPCVVTGTDRIETERDAAVQHGRRSSRCSAGRGWGAACCIFCDELVHHIRGEAIRQIPYVERDSGTSAARRASCASSFEQQPRWPVGLRVLGQRQMDAGDIMPGLDRSCRGNAESTPPDIAASTFIWCPSLLASKSVTGQQCVQPGSRAAVQSQRIAAAVRGGVSRHASRL